MLDGISLDQLRVLAAVADAGSFRAAAGRLRRAQSAVSHAIASLEGQLGLVLLDRSGYRPALTEEGRAVLADARVVLAKVDGLRAGARGFSAGVELHLDVAVDDHAFAPWVAAALREVHDAYPSVGVRLRSGPLGAPLAAVADGRSVLGVTVSDEVRDPAVEFGAIGRLALVAVAAPDHPLARQGAGAAPHDHLQIVVVDPTSITDGAAFGIASPATWRVDDVRIKRELIVAGIGWGSLPEHLVGADLATGRLRTVEPLGVGAAGRTELPVYLAWRGDAALGPAAKRLRRSLTDRSR